MFSSAAESIIKVLFFWLWDVVTGRGEVGEADVAGVVVAEGLEEVFWGESFELLHEAINPESSANDTSRAITGALFFISKNPSLNIFCQSYKPPSGF